LRIGFGEAAGNRRRRFTDVETFVQIKFLFFKIAFEPFGWDVKNEKFLVQITFYMLFHGFLVLQRAF
jgi:hypothetical protein